MIGIQIAALIFALWMIYFSYLHFRRAEFKKIEFLLWEILWLGLIMVVIFPKSVEFILKTFSINRTFDLVVIVGIVILYGVTFRTYVITKRIDKKVEKFVREESLKNINK
ncbi:MAG: DUF2304 domain-containing protein [Patescibacteria group bacterium]